MDKEKIGKEKIGKENLIILNSTGAIGDMVIASALIPELTNNNYRTGIISKQFTLPLWQGLEGLTFESEEDISKNAKIFDISDYLINFPHSNSLPIKKGKSHLCEWMAYSLFQKSGIQVFPSRDNVMIKLTPEEVQYGQEIIREFSKEHNNLPILIMAPYSGTKNRNISKNTLEEVVKGVSDFVAPCLLTPIKDGQYIEGTFLIGAKTLRDSSAILFSSDAYLGVDSGPLHMINGALQGTSTRRDINTSKNKIIVAIGSSHPEAVSYKDNQVLKSNRRCVIAPCGAHGYVLPKEYGKFFGKEFYRTDKDNSGCMFADYNSFETSFCMEAISSEEVIETIEKIIKQK